MSKPDKGVISILFRGKPDAKGYVSGRVTWWCDATEKWRHQAFRAPAEELCARVATDFPERRLVTSGRVISSVAPKPTAP